MLLKRQDKEEFRLLYLEKTKKELSKHYGVSVYEIDSMVELFGLKKRKHDWPEARIEKFTSMYPTTSTLDLQVIFNCSQSAIFKQAKKLGLKKHEQYIKNQRCDDRRHEWD